MPEPLTVTGNPGLSDEVIRLIRAALELPETYPLVGSLTPVEVPGWDSFGWMTIITAFEEHFEFSFDFSELESVYSISQLTEVVRVKLTAAV